jgi:probable addiction module antidote protein
MPIETKPFDVAEYLNTEGRAAAYLAEAFAEGDPAFIAKALGDVARARNITDIARKMGVSRETVYQALSAEGNPKLSTLLGAAKALGFKLSIVPDTPAAEMAPARPKKSATRGKKLVAAS